MVGWVQMNIVVDAEKWGNNPLCIQILHISRSVPCLAGHASLSLPTLHMLHRYITTLDDKEEDCHAAVSSSSLFPRNCVSWINIPLCSRNEEWAHNGVDKGGILLPNPNQRWGQTHAPEALQPSSIPPHAHLQSYSRKSHQQANFKYSDLYHLALALFKVPEEQFWCIITLFKHFLSPPYSSTVIS